MKKILFAVLISSLLIGTFGAINFALAKPGVTIDPSLYPKGAPTISGKTDEEIETLDSARYALTAKVVNVLFAIAGSVAIFYILSNGFWIISSAGAEETLTQHKKGLTWAVVGLILAILAYSILTWMIKLSFDAHEEKVLPAGTTDLVEPASQKAA